MYSGYQSSYAYSNVDVKVGLAYVAHQFVMKQKVDRWGIEEKFGIGYFKYQESAKGTSAFFRAWDMISCSERNITCLTMSGSERNRLYWRFSPKTGFCGIQKR